MALFTFLTGGGEAASGCHAEAQLDQLANHNEECIFFRAFPPAICRPISVIIFSRCSSTDRCAITEVAVLRFSLRGDDRRNKGQTA